LGPKRPTEFDAAVKKASDAVSARNIPYVITYAAWWRKLLA
jgi:hypothetical protein